MNNLFKNVKGYYYSFITGIKNLWKWFPVIWMDRDWDHAYIENILYHKLVNMYNFLISEDAVTNWDVPEQDKALRSLRICITILERRRQSFYVDLCANVYEEHIIKLSYEIENRDERLLGQLIGKYLSYWWD